MSESVNVNIKADSDVQKNESDPFYNESNLAYLRRGIEALNAGEGVEHEIIEE